MFLTRKAFEVLKHARKLSSGVSIKEVKIPVHWGSIAVKQWGDDPSLPGIICCHGYLENAASFDELIPLLPKTYVYYAVDFPGHGMSSHAAPGMFYQDLFYMLTIEYTRRYFGLKTFGALAHSMGGGEDLCFALAHPTTMDFLISLDFPCLPHNPFEERIMNAGRRIDKIIGQEKKKDRPKTYDELASGMMAAWKGALDEKAVKTLLKRHVSPLKDTDNLWQLNRDVRTQNNQVFGLYTNSHLDPVQKKSSTPRKALNMCVIEFDSGVSFAPDSLKRDNLKAFRRLGEVEYHRIKGHHSSHLTDADRVAPMVKNFLDKQRRQRNAGAEDGEIK